MAANFSLAVRLLLARAFVLYGFLSCLSLNEQSGVRYLEPYPYLLQIWIYYDLGQSRFLM